MVSRVARARVRRVAPWVVVAALLWAGRSTAVAQGELGDPAPAESAPREPAPEAEELAQTLSIAGAFAWPQLDRGARTSFGLIGPGGGLEVVASFGLPGVDGYLALGPALGASLWQPRGYILDDGLLGGLVDLDLHADLRVPLDARTLELVARLSLGGTISVLESAVAQTDHSLPQAEEDVGGGLHVASRVALEWLPDEVGLTVGFAVHYRHLWHAVEVLDEATAAPLGTNDLSVDLMQLAVDAGLVLRL